MPEWICEVDTAEQLDSEIRKIAALENVGRGDEIYGTFTVQYSDEVVKRASLVPWLENRGVAIVWRESDIFEFNRAGLAMHPPFDKWIDRHREHASNY